MNDFIKDLEKVVEKMKPELDAETYSKLKELENRLTDLYQKNLVKINHSIMELVCAKHLIKNGFEVAIEHTLNGISCDIYATKGFGTMIVEVETGFVPPENALDPQLYLNGRVASKITRYSGYANKFCLATPLYYVMQIPAVFVKPPRFRTEKEIESMKQLCDLYYTKPPITFEEIKNARLHSIYTINVDSTNIREWDINEYMGKAALWSV